MPILTDRPRFDKSRIILTNLLAMESARGHISAPAATRSRVSKLDQRTFGQYNRCLPQIAGESLLTGFGRVRISRASQRRGGLSGLAGCGEAGPLRRFWRGAL
ncbi:hypothetical protein, partial [Oceanibacterium hippocampi]|uniref:hypothetical protein n=1 Tax=Oceanibacterium hippocampi TaxID=745714 RepID=UPI001C3802BF